MSSYARELLNFRYFVHADGGKKEEMEKILLEEKKKAPNKIHYYVSACREFPGKFILSYLPRVKVGIPLNFQYIYIQCIENCKT